MRLICPNCAAQYEVDASVIPDAGRDVQCSNCGQTWFQPSALMLQAEAAAQTIAPEPQEWEVPADAAMATAPDALTTAFADATPDDTPPETEEAVAEAPPPAQDLTEETAPAAPPEEPPTAEQEDAEDDGKDDTITATVAAMVAAQAPPAPVQPPSTQASDDGPGLAPAPAAGSTPRRALDDSLLAILREEAEREAAARRAEGSTLETQEELNLEPAASRAASRAAAKLAALQRASETTEDAPAADRVAHLHDDGEDEPAAPQVSRRERLPDIEEINSTLRATSDRAEHAAAKDAPQTLARQRSGFRLGFVSVLTLGIAAMTVYATAPRLVQIAPALTPALSSYVNTVDRGRIWLDAQLQAIIVSVQEKPDT